MTEQGQSLLLRRDRGKLELVLGNVVLLSSAALDTELVFGRLAAEGLAAAAGPSRVIVGGLGFGATLRGVLEVASPDTEVVVVEKLRAVCEVARAEAAELVAGALDDPRVVLRCADVADVIAESAPSSVAAILLDVDNGPAWASFRSNARLYSGAALGVAGAALSPGGLYAVWSGYPVDGFVGVLRKAGFAPRIVPLYEGPVVRARAYVGARR